MERRHKSVTRNTRSGLNKDAAGKVGVGSSSELPHIAELISDGEITVGTLVPVGCVAIATDGHNSLAMLKRREGETLAHSHTSRSGDWQSVHRRRLYRRDQHARKLETPIAACIP